MRILLANPRGFCAGVDRAIEIVERALQLFGAPIYVRHEVVHNRHVVERLRALGAVFVEELDEVPDGATVIFSAHGVSTAVENEAARRALQVFDATCPLVTKVHMEVTRFAREAREVILIGHAGHPEVEGTMGRFDTSFGGQIFLVESIEDVERVAVRDPSRLAFVTQTTLSVDDTARDGRGAAAALSVAAGAAQGRHLLRDAEPPGRGQEAARTVRRAAGGRLAQQLELQPPARTGRSRRGARATWSMAPRTCSANGSTARARSASPPAPRRRRCWCSRWSSACASGAGPRPRSPMAGPSTLFLRCRAHCGKSAL